MVKFLVELFHNSSTNKSNAQLIFTTHETSILSQDVFRRDQIWFCEKRNKATVLYSLVEFKARKGVTDLEKAYLSGRYGALPFFKDITMAMGN
jgi:AAA15 family ATPase/GTPase